MSKNNLVAGLYTPEPGQDVDGKDSDAAAIYKNVGLHTFRHSFGTLLQANGEDVKTVQELLGHANSRITLNVYTQAVNSHKQVAHSKVVINYAMEMSSPSGSSTGWPVPPVTCSR